MGKYDGLDQEQLVRLLEKRDREKRLGLVWERDEIEADNAIDQNFVAAVLDEELSDKSSPWKNLVIEGDNFDALRWLRMTYSGRVKCIYVDPPYNTGSKDWVYNDSYVDKEDRYRFSTWLEFLFRRFALARELLTDDGAILVSINDENRSLMELMLDQALPGMRVGSFTWRTRIGGNEGGNHFFSQNHEHILVYANSEFRFAGTEKTFEMYKFHDSARNEAYRISDLSVAVAYDDKRAGTAYYPLYNPKTNVWYPCNPNRVWGYVSKDRSKGTSRIKTKYMEEWIEEGRIHFPEGRKLVRYDTLAQLQSAYANEELPKSGGVQLIRPDLPGFEGWVGKLIGFGTPAFKRYVSELKRSKQPISSWVVPQSESTGDEGEGTLVTGTNDEGSKEIKAIFGAKAFNYPKPSSLLKAIIGQCVFSGETVLDFFAGSATTAQAVMELNAEDGGDRSFIMTSSTEATTDAPDRNVCRDITAERIRRLNSSSDKKYTALAAEFAYLKTREIDFENLDYELDPSEVWNALEAIHDLPLTPYDPNTPFNEHCGASQVIIYVDQVNEMVFKRIEELAKPGIGVTVYSWSPGQLRERLLNSDVELRSVRATLVKKFQQ